MKLAEAVKLIRGNIKPRQGSQLSLHIELEPDGTHAAEWVFFDGLRNWFAKSLAEVVSAAIQESAAPTDDLDAIDAIIHTPESGEPVG